MDSQPPSAPPPPPPIPQPPLGGLPPSDGGFDAYAYDRIEPPSTGGVVVFGILNLIFALICGCGHGTGVAAISGLGEADVSMLSDASFNAEMDKAFEEQLAEASDEDERRAMEAMRDYMKSDEFKDVAREAIQYIGTSKTGEGLRQISAGGLIAQLLMLLSGGLLLARVRIGRPLALLATFSTIVVQVAWMMFAIEAVDDLEFRLIERMDEAAAEQGIDDPSEVNRVLSDHLTEDFGTTFRSMAVVGTVMSAIYPLIAFLVILLSGNIRKALAGHRDSLRQDVF